MQILITKLTGKANGRSDTMDSASTIAAVTDGKAHRKGQRRE
jgi:hypothetical protein